MGALAPCLWLRTQPLRGQPIGGDCPTRSPASLPTGLAAPSLGSRPQAPLPRGALPSRACGTRHPAPSGPRRLTPRSGHSMVGLPCFAGCLPVLPFGGVTPSSPPSLIFLPPSPLARRQLLPPQQLLRPGVVPVSLPSASGLPLAAPGAGVLASPVWPLLEGAEHAIAHTGQSPEAARFPQCVSLRSLSQ